MSIFITSSFSMSMFPISAVGCGIYLQSMTLEDVEDYVEARISLGASVTSFIRHAALAKILTKETRLALAHCTDYFTVTEKDEIIFANYVGQRIAPRATKLPEGGRVEWYRINLLK